MLARQKGMKIGDKIVVAKQAERYKSWPGKKSPFKKVGLIKEIFKYNNGEDTALIQIGGPNGIVYMVFLHEIEPYADRPPPIKPSDFYYD